MKQLLLWNPYLDTCGGGEKHMLQICEYYISQGYELTIAWSKDISKDLERKLHLSLPPGIKWIPKLTTLSLIQKIKLLHAYDLLLYATDGSYFFSTAKQTYCFCMVPDAKLYRMTLWNQIKTRGWIWISNSKFTQKNLKAYGITSSVVYPVTSLPADRLPDTQHISGTSLTFITVGRFFRHLHSKRHDVAIAWFVQFIQSNPQYAASKLILIGGVKPEDKKYYESLKQLASSYQNIIFKPNISHIELGHFYKTGDFYIHFAGWGVDSSKYPERTEHLGITPIEAMAYGCIPLCFANGGIPEVIEDGVNGYTFKSLDDLSRKVISLSHDPAKQEHMRIAGTETIERKFSIEALGASLDALSVTN
ncbi:MAG: glycosyltransferase family 4 protein [bacterium]